jgi:RNA polymerase sigma-70 factor (ECF subfamily)
MEALARAWDRNREDLLRYVARLLADSDAAQDIVQQAAVRAMNAATPPAEEVDLRKWLFRITSNLAIDELRRRRTWAETALLDAREDAEGDPQFVAASVAMRGTQEVVAIAREHLAFCFSCVLRSLVAHRAAALLLAEVYGFSIRDSASILAASAGQVKNWLQEARDAMRSRHIDRCALVTKNGVCYQSSELSGFFNGVGENPLAGTSGSLQDRLEVIAGVRLDLGLWHRRLLRVIEDRNHDRPPTSS